MLTAKEEIELIKLLEIEDKEIESLKLLYEQTNDIYIPLYENKSRYLILYGGAGSGKSIFIGQKVVKKISSKKGINYLIVRNTGNSNRISTFPLIKQTINKMGLSNKFKINESDMRIKHISTGNEMVFAGLDDVEKVKSITFTNGNLTDIWIEESSEVEKDSFEQLDLRMRGIDSEYQMILTYNPTSITLWQKDFIEDIVDRPIPIGEIINKDNLTVLRTTYQNNKFIDEGYKRKLESYKTKDPYFYQVYCIGEYGVTGKTVFDSQKLTARLMEVKTYKLISGRFMEVDGQPKWLVDVNGAWTIFKQPQPNRFYVVGADVAEGIEGDDNQKEGDNSAAQILDNNSLEQVAVYADHIDPDRYADELYMAGMYFNKALIAVEINMEGGTNRNLERRNYPNLYMRETEDDIAHKIQSKFGFRTTEITRRNIVSDLIEYIREHSHLVNDPKTIDEMLTFVRNKNGRPEAQSGKKDDRVLSYAISLQAALSGQQKKASFGKEIDYKKLGKMSADAQEDFYGADEATKKILCERWQLYI